MTEHSELGAELGKIRAVGRLPGDLVAGVTYPFWVLAILQQTPRLWGYVMIPILLNLVIGALLYAGLVVPAWQAINGWTAGVPAGLAQWIAGLPAQVSPWLNWLPALAGTFDDVLRWLLAIALLLVTGFLLVQFGAIFGAPWYGSLSEQIEALRTGTLPSMGPMSLQRALRDIWRALTFQLKKLLLAIALATLLFIVSLVPIIGSGFASVGWVVLAAILVGLDFLDPTLERRRLNFRTKLGLFGQTLPASLSFSLVCLTLVSVPLLNLLAVPLCVAAGTLFGCDRILPKLSPK